MGYRGKSLEVSVKRHIDREASDIRDLTRCITGTTSTHSRSLGESNQEANHYRKGVGQIGGIYLEEMGA